MRKRLITTGLALTIVASAGGDLNTSEPEAPSFWKTTYQWFDVSTNYLNWSQGTERRTGGSKADFLYLELEGGMGWEWGELYFFTDWENPGRSFDAAKAPDDGRWVIKPVLDINIPAGEGDWWQGFQVHIQDYYLYGDAFWVNNLVVGLAYKFQGEHHFFRPFLGLHYVDDKFNPATWNGFMGGWVFNYDFEIGSQRFSLSNWHEIEFDRDARYGKDGADGASWGINGALAGWWHLTRHFTLGLQYRYAYQKLGYDGYQDGIITSLKYNF
jgi:hypothetical protein